MSKNDALGDRMKKYEYVTRTHLINRMPVIIRLDGKAFHTFTRGFKRPFDDVLIESMQETTKYLCEHIQGCVLGYTQSDEITLVLVDYKELDSSAWFDYNIQKCASVAASMATMVFNETFGRVAHRTYPEAWRNSLNSNKYIETLFSRVGTAMFDARCFNIPKEEVTNCILWRQNDATRNSIQMVGQAYFSHNQLHGKSCNQIQDMLMLEKEINWNDYETHYKRGSCCIKVQQEGEKRPKWVIDTEIPIFKGEGRKYIESLVFVGE